MKPRDGSGARNASIPQGLSFRAPLPRRGFTVTFFEQNIPPAINEEPYGTPLRYGVCFLS
jgi:hypothetical protein